MIFLFPLTGYKHTKKRKCCKVRTSHQKYDILAVFLDFRRQSPYVEHEKSL